MMKSFVLAGLVALAVVAAPQYVEAAPITGGVDIIGFGVQPVGDTNWDNATGVAFTAPGITGNGTGSFAGTNGSIATLTDFTFDPVGASTPFTLWTYASGAFTYSFRIDQITSFNRTGGGGTTSVDVFGVGTFSITGPGSTYEDTVGSWVFTGNNAATTQFSFSSSQAVPEPASLALLGFGLIGAGLARRRVRR